MRCLPHQSAPLFNFNFHNRLPDEENEFDDEYIQAMRSDENECRTEYANKCRYSILGYLLSPERPIL